MGQVLSLSLVAAIYPTLLAAVTVMLVSPSPKRLLIGYVLGAYTMSITIGILVVFAFGNQSSSTSSTTLSPAMDIGFGLVLLIVALVIGTGRDQTIREKRAAKKAAKHPEQEGIPPKWMATLGKGSARITFGVGALLSLPSVSYLVALGEIDELNYGTVETVGLIILFNVIMFLLVELPLLGYFVNPEWTTKAVAGFRDWIARKGRRAIYFGCLVVGALMVVRGVAGAIAAG